MENTEQNFSIDHTEEKFVAVSPILSRAHPEEASDAETVGEAEGASQIASVITTDEVLPQEESEAEVLGFEMVDSEAITTEKVEIVMGMKQTIEVDLVAEEADQAMNAPDMSPESAQKSELNLFIGSKETSPDVNLEGKDVTSGVESDLDLHDGGRPADKEKTESVTLGIKQKEIDMEFPSPVFRSEIARPSNPIDLEVQQATELGSKFQASTTIFVEKPDVVESIEQEQVALTGSAVPQSIEQEQVALTGSEVKPDVFESIQQELVALTGSEVPQSPPIEVERKFQVTDFDENKLLEANGKLISEVSFEDVYFDNNDYNLILSDSWLRKRNQRWEFKIPVTRDPSLLYMSTQYHELEDEKAISKALQEAIGQDADVSETQGIMEDFKLKPFATFTTTRKSYQLPSDCTVVIDSTGFGYSVGEIEVMVKDNSEIGEAIERIDAIAGQLGFQMLSLTELATKC